MLDISGVDHSSDESRDTHCIILYGEFIMSLESHPRIRRTLSPGLKRKVKRAARFARRHISILTGKKH